ncbi:MAG: ABC-type transport auxiliary lipoprotein family protein [Gammaproteobacteria bacterium]|nr:ABC-type transport auxiliary lipoprotein family protein [Gammaproteobacteria bacterium]
MLSYFYPFLIVIFSVVLTGCSSVLSPVKVGAQHEYLINTVPTVAASRVGHATVLVMAPEAGPIYSSKEMVYTTYPYQVASFANNRWAASPSVMLQSLMVQTLQNTHHYRAVVAVPFPGHYDLVLRSELLKLQQDFTRSPSVIRLTLRAQLINANTNLVVAAKEFTIVERAPRNDPYGGVIAANRAAARLMKQLAVFCEKH